MELVLDTLPGRIFDAKVQSVGWGVRKDRSIPNRPAEINEPTGLVRNPQRFAVKIEPNREDYVPGSVRYGSQANVIVYATGNAIVNAIGALWIRLVAILTVVQLMSSPPAYSSWRSRSPGSRTRFQDRLRQKGIFLVPQHPF